MKILVISPCSESQNKKPMPAAELYRGPEHQKIKAGLGEVRKHPQYGGITIKWYIISTKHGLVKDDKVLAPYNVPNSKSPILEDGKKLNEDISKLIKDYDLVFFVLGKAYVEALQLPFQDADSVTQIFLIYTKTEGYRHLIPENLPNSNCYAVELKFDDGFRDIRRTKGSAFKRLCEAACHDGFEVFEKVKENPQLILDIVQ